MNRASERSTNQSDGRGARPLSSLQRNVGNRSVQWLHQRGALRAGLANGPAAEAQEREARRTAERLVDETRSAATSSPRSERSAEETRRAEARSRTSTASDKLGGVGGRPLPASVRSFFEAGLGSEFGDVRIHTGARADAMADAVDATAFTVGGDVVFRSGAYRPGTRRGTRLLAHELTHVVQQSDAGPSRIQRQQTGRQSYEREQHDIVEFDFVDDEQEVENTGEEGARSTTGGNVDLHYDSGSGTFRCTFHLYWTFPRGWSDERREKYRQRFAEVVGERWSRQHRLVEYDGSGEDAEPTGRTANVVVDFEHVSMPAEYERLSSLSARAEWLAEHPEARQRKTRAFQVEVSPEEVTDSVRGREVTLDPESLEAGEKGVERYRDYGRSEEITDIEQHMNPPYGHYEDADVPLDLPDEGTTYEQVPAAHEFGHMIGLADEYILDTEDYQDVPAGEREEAIENRNAATGRIMNIGSRVTPDAYRPFARWLSSLTDSEWRVR